MRSGLNGTINMVELLLNKLRRRLRYKMHIIQLIIKNFKTYQNVKINISDKINLIVGENNIGKNNNL